MLSINMRSQALSIKAQGVGSCFCEQVRLVTEGLADKYEIRVNSWRRSDITHYHTVNLSYFFERLFTRHRTAGIGYVHFLPDTIDESLQMPKLYRSVFYRYMLAFYNSMDYLVVVNPTVIKKLADYGINHPKIVYIPNFVSHTDFHPQDAEARAKARAEFGFSSSDFVVMGAGQLQTRKGIFDFVETARRMPDVKFVWAGGFSFGKMSDGYEEIVKLTQNLPENTRFLGIIDRDKMAGLYNASDLFFLPSFNELFPMTILEAAACAKPILLRNMDFYKVILHDYYLTGENVDDFVNNIQKLRESEPLRQSLSAKALECHQFYSEASILKMWEHLYDEACFAVSKESLIAFGRRK